MNYVELYNQKLDEKVELIKNSETKEKIRIFVNQWKKERLGDGLIPILARNKCEKFLTLTEEELNHIKL